MSLTMTFRNLEGTDAMRVRAQKKFQKLQRHFSDPIEGNMVCSIQRHRHSVELTVTAGSDTLRASDTSDDMYASIDAVVNTISTNARRNKERRLDRQHSGSIRQAVPDEE